MQWLLQSCCPSAGLISFATAEPHVLHTPQQVSDSPVCCLCAAVGTGVQHGQLI